MYNTTDKKAPFSMDIIRRLTGMQDVSPQHWMEMSHVCQTLSNCFSLYGYQSVGTPLLEETELFLRKSGGELAARMYTFTDPGGRRVSLRPEFTASVVRGYIEGGLGQELPLRVQYRGPAFRYPLDQEGKYRQFTQVGAELLGAAGPAADAEILALACRGLSAVGVKEYTVTVGHLGVVNSFLGQLGLSERGRVFLLERMPVLKGGADAVEAVRSTAEELGLLRCSGNDERLTKVVRGLSDNDARDLMDRFFSDTVSGPTGQRTSQEVSSRYLRRLMGVENPECLDRALKLAERLAMVNGESANALKQARELATEFSLKHTFLDDLEQVLEYLDAYSLDGMKLRVDFGLARGIAYYTGVVFEVTHPMVQAGPSICGGGRYDVLVSALGGPMDTPALGFAYAVEQVMSARQQVSKTELSCAATVLVVPKVTRALLAAVRVAEKLRNGGTQTELDLIPRSAEELRSYAAKKGISTVKVVREDGVVEGI